MEVEFWQFLIVCPLVFLAGFVDAVAGGGGLISLPSYMIAGLPVHNSIATNKLSSSMGTTLATFRYAKKGFIPWKKAIFCIICAFIGSACGAKLALILNDFYFKIIMLVILPLTAIYVTKTKALEKERENISFLKSTIVAMGVALFIGAYDGFYGPGAGTFLILLLTSFANLKLSEANGLSKIINLSTNISSLIVYLINGKVIIILGLTAGLFSIAGNYIGTKMFVKGGAKIVKPIMITVLTVFFVKIILDLFGIS